MKKIILSLLLLISILPCTIHAEDEINETITELGTIEELSPIFNGEINLLGSLDYAGTIGRVWVNNELRYLTKLTLDGNPIYCIQPGVLAQKGEGYSPDYEYLDYNTKEKMWKICFYGYGHYGRNSDEYWVATQLLLWETLGIYGDPYYDASMTKPYDIQDEKWDILNAIQTGGATPSFNGYTFEVNLNETFTVHDNNNVLNEYNIYGGLNTNISKNNNDLNITVTNMTYDSNFNFSNDNNGIHANIVYTKPGSQTVFMASSSKPGNSFGFNVKLNTGDLKINKIDEYCNPADGYHEFGIYTDEACSNLIKSINTNGTSFASLNNYLAPNTYYIKELNTSFPYLLNSQIFKIIISRNETTTLNITNTLTSLPLTINKNDIEEPLLPLNDTWYTVYDMTDIHKPIKKPVKVFSKILLSDLCTGEYKLENPELVKEEDGYLIGLANGFTTLYSNNETIYLQIDTSIDESYIDYQIIEDDDIFPQLNEPTPLFKGRTGYSYLRLINKTKHNLPYKNHTIKIFEDENLTTPLIEVTSDDFGVIELDNLNLKPNTTYYYSDNDILKDSFTYIPQKDGTLVIDNIKYGRVLEVCEVQAKEGYEINKEACKIHNMNMTSNYNEPKDIINNQNIKRRIDLTISKRDSISNDLLDLAGFDIYQITNNEEVKLGTYYTGLFQIKSDPNTNIVYWADEENKKYSQTNEEGILLLPLNEGTYYYQILDENNAPISEIQQTSVLKGSIYFEDLIYGNKLKVCEIKTPDGYYENKQCHDINIKQEIGIDHLEFNIFNDRIIVDPVNSNVHIIPNMGV